MEEKVWHRFYPEGTPPEVELQKMTMPEALEAIVRDYPDHVAYIYMGKVITFRELRNLVHRCANALADLGVKPGDKVGMLLPNLPQVIIADYAVYYLGAVTVMNNPLYTERELLHQLNDSDTTCIVTLDLLLPRVLKLQPQTGIKKIVTCHINDYLPFPVKQLFPFVKKDMYRKDIPHKDVYPFMDLIRQYPDTPVKNRATWEETAALLYTGGTTGVSKGVELTHANISSVVQIFSAWFPDLKRGDLERIAGIYPVFHSAGYSVSQNFIIWKGWSCILIPRPEPAVITKMLKKFRPTFLPGVPTIYVGLLSLKAFREMDLSFVKGYFGGAAPLPADTLNQLKKLHGAIINDVYGATENTAFATATPWKGKVKIGTVGVPLPNTEIKVVDLETGEKELGPDEDGEICVRGPQVMKGYYKRPDETAAVLKDGWFYLGDIGHLDKDGYLTIADRKKNMIVAGGYNVYPAEVDQVLMRHPDVMEACTIGIPDEYRGETVKAYVVPVAGKTLDADALTDYCNENLAAYKVPRGFRIVDELPKTAVGKLLRRAVREMELERIKTS